MKNFRISKYNPTKRNSDGFYLEEEWTSISDIGKRFKDKTLGSDHYIEMEERYIGVIRDYCLNTGINSFILKDLIRLDLTSNKSIQSVYSTELILTHENIHGNKIFGLEEIQNVARLMLREDLHGQIFEVKGRFTAEFGYDYYMYVSIEEVYSQVLEKIIAEKSLFWD